MAFQLTNLTEYRNLRAAIIEIIFDNALPSPTITREQIFDNVKRALCDKRTKEHLQQAEKYLSALTEDQFIEFCIGEQKEYEDGDAKETQALLVFVAENLLPQGKPVILPNNPEDQPNPGG